MNDSKPLTSHQSAPEASTPLVLRTSHGLHAFSGPVTSDYPAYLGVIPITGVDIRLELNCRRPLSW